MRIGIVGATGAVGRSLLSIALEKYKPNTFTLFASHRSQERVLEHGGYRWPIKRPNRTVLKSLDVVFLCCPPQVSRQVAEWTMGPYLIDGSPAFRQDPSVPLIIPEINGHQIKLKPPLISSPNCITTLTLMALFPLHQKFGLTRFWASTYQAVSGIGNSGIGELKGQLSEVSSKPQFFPRPIAHNVIPQVGNFLEEETEEEEKLRLESQKILSLPRLKVQATGVRVPVFRAHSISLNAEFRKKITPESAKLAWKQFPGIHLHEFPSQYPTPIEYETKTVCGIGRVRQDGALRNGLALWVVGDQLLKGAAWNMWQIFTLLGE
jgi:aspartate-semialdehyde dehydrogenase